MQQQVLGLSNLTWSGLLEQKSLAHTQENAAEGEVKEVCDRGVL